MKDRKKFKVGDTVEIVNYGHKGYIHEENLKGFSYPILSKEEGGFVLFDASPDIVGHKGVIKEIKAGTNTPVYFIDWIDKEETTEDRLLEDNTYNELLGRLNSRYFTAQEDQLKLVS